MKGSSGIRRLTLLALLLAMGGCGGGGSATSANDPGETATGASQAADAPSASSPNSTSKDSECDNNPEDDRSVAYPAWTAEGHSDEELWAEDCFFSDEYLNWFENRPTEWERVVGETLRISRDCYRDAGITGFDTEIPDDVLTSCGLKANKPYEDYYLANPDK